MAALLVMPLLALLVFGLLGLSSIEIRKSASVMARDEARANARLALITAIGQLQKHLGPDQRVSSDSMILEDKVGPGENSNLAQPHWTNVWRTVKEDGTPYIVRNGEDGGLRDTRATGSWDREEERIACLVSGNEGVMAYSQGSQSSAPDEDEMIELVGAGSTDEETPGSKVSAPRVELMDGEEVRGQYAWWVGDLGVRANIATEDGSKESRATLAELRPTMLSQDASIQAIGNQGDMANEQRSKMVSQGQLALGGTDAEVIKKHYHDLTVDSVGVLADVRQGGLKKDLTAYLLSSGSISDEGSGDASIGVQDFDRLVGPRNSEADSRSGSPGQAGRFSLTSPTFGLMRDWARRAEQTPFGNYSTSPEYPATAGNKVQFRQLGESDISPVLVEGSLYYNVSYYRRSAVDPQNPYGMRLHIYPRVVMWNPYNFQMNVGDSMINLHINGKKMIEVTMDGKPSKKYRMYWGLSGGITGGGSQGSLFFKMQGATLGPGETVMWSPAANQPYQEETFSGNVLSPGVAPSPSRSFYQDSRKDNQPLFKPDASWPPTPGLKNNCLAAMPKEWREIVLPKPTGNLQEAGWTQADDYRMVWKPLSSGGSSIDLAGFNRLPTAKFISCAYQYGDEDEIPVVWSSIDPVPFPGSTAENPSIQLAPDRRTRDGFRLRWSEEHASNRLGSGSLAGTAHLQCAPIANWNMRGSYFYRSPFDNVTDIAPNFFGIYTRDLFDAAVDWNEMAPRFQGSTYRGDPFDHPLKFTNPRILFDVPRRGAEISSLGAFQHVNFSQMVWHPSYALGNSLADPRIDLTRTEPSRRESINRDKGGWNQDSIGYSTDGRSDTNQTNPTTHEDNWAWTARNFLEQAPIEQNVVYDLSYELNHSLWDEFFLSSGTDSEKSSFLADPQRSALPNGRMRLISGTAETAEDDLVDFHRASSRLAVDGAFNVNSTSVTAWEAMLLSSVETQFGDKVAFPRIPGLEREYDGKGPRSTEAWGGQRTLSRDEVRSLAEEIVREVKTRGPFLSMSDFVNRRLADDATGKKGALQAAIDRAGINSGFQGEWPLDNTRALPNYNHPDHIKDPTRMEQRNKPDTTAWGALGFLTQADVMQFLAPALSARSDTFVVRAYGSSVSKDGKVQAEAWCEAVVQRTPTPLRPDSTGLNPLIDSSTPDFGRHFEVKRFRWLGRDEV